MTTEPIQALIIRPDTSHSVEIIEQDIATLQELVGGYIEAVTTEHAVLWLNEEGKIHGMPINRMATYLWWKLQPEMEGRDHMRGCVLVTGLADPDGDCTPVEPDLLRLYGEMDHIRRSEDKRMASG